MIRNKSILFKNNKKVIELLTKDEDIVEYIRQLPNTKDVENIIITKIACDFYSDKKSFTKIRKELLNFILHNKLNWSEILKSLAESAVIVTK